MTKLEIEIEKLNQLRTFHDNTHSTIAVLEANLESMLAERESIATSQLLGGTAINLSAIDKKISDGEKQIKSLQNQLIFEKNTIEKQRTEIIPKIEIEEKVELLHSKNAELKSLIDNFDYSAFNTYMNQINTLFDKCNEITKQCNLDGYVAGNQRPTSHLEYRLNNFNYLFNTSPAPLIDFLKIHFECTNNSLSELELNMKTYEKNHKVRLKY